jgi:hypothetical protein
MKKLLLATAALCVFSTGVNACGGIPRVCYSRIYDSTHLAKHPDQTVSAMRIALSDSDIAEGVSDFDLSVQFRGDHDKWQWAWCVFSGNGAWTDMCVVLEPTSEQGSG